jgi:hypothetical protein
MTGSLRNHWEYTLEEIWESIASYDEAPTDLFSGLYNIVDDFLALPTPTDRLVKIHSDALSARQAFLALKGSDFINEAGIVKFLEAVYEEISGYGISGYAEFFKLRLREFIRKYNLRYRLDDQFKLRFLLPGSFANLYSELQRLNTADSHLNSLLQDFEHAFDCYARTQDPSDLKTCITKASNYAEGLASFTLGNPSTGNTLGALANTLTCWPHDKIKESLVNLYHFCCDYPGIRHGGTPANKRRELTAIDSTLVCLLLLGFSGYLSPSVDERSVLGV